MRILSWSDLEGIDFLEKELHGGGVVLAEGDTVLGLLADVSEKGLAQLDLIKGRSKKPYLILVPDRKAVSNFVEEGFYERLQIEKIMDICWPGPVTLILRAKKTALQWTKSDQGNVALRIPNHSGLLKLLQRRGALFSTSANSSGMPVANNFGDVESSIMNVVVCAIANDKIMISTSSLSSTILDCGKDCITIIRRGDFDIGKLSRVMGDNLFC